MKKTLAVCAALTLGILCACSSFGRDELSRINFGEFIPLTGTVMEAAEYTAENIRVTRQEDRLVMSAGSVRIDYNLVNGLADYYHGEDLMVVGVFTETNILGTAYRSIDMSRLQGSVFLEAISDGFGPGLKVSVQNHGENLYLWQHFYLYSQHDYIVLETVVEVPTGTMTNYIAPIAAGTGGPDTNVILLTLTDDPRFLFIPWDNDGFIRYRSDRLVGGGESYNVSAIFDNTTRRGLVTGAITHDAWKTGIRARSVMGRGVSPVVDFRVFGGIATSITRDSEPHGSLIGHQVYSPKIFFGFFNDWRDGMEQYGRANAIIAPALPWDRGTIFGWNAWAAVADKITYDIYTDASDFFRNELPDFANHDGITYINYDSFWGWVTSNDQIRQAANHVRRNNQIPGIYGGFYTHWDAQAERLNDPVDNTDYAYSYGDIILRDQRGRPLPPWGTAMSLDPTHPGTILRSVNQIREMIDMGYRYVKLDFMAHGAREGRFHNRAIRTGIQAYNYGMQQFIDSIAQELSDQEFFISLSIAPMFPHQYAHARRISCDIFGAIDNTEYLLNSLTYGWWQGGTIYSFNDPDHIVLYQGYNRDSPTEFNEALSAYVAAAIHGFMLNSDDVRLPGAQERLRQILTNREINTMAADGISFRPVEGNTGDRSADTFVRHDQDASYLAVFNFSRDRPKTMTVNMDRIGLDPNRTWRVRNMVEQSDQASVSAGSMTINLEPAQPGLFRLY